MKNFLFRFLHFLKLREIFGLKKSLVAALAAMEYTAHFVTPVEFTTDDYLERCATEEEGDEQFNRTYDLVKRLSAFRKIEEMQRIALDKGKRMRIEQEELIQRMIKCN